MKADCGRRAFLRALGGGAAAWALAGAAETKPLRGVFPIGQTPVAASGQLDLECLANEVRFCNRYGVHGFAWPQIASGWDTLSDAERRSGAETILAAGRDGRTALVIGVQDRNGDVERSVAYARHAAGNGADAIISLPPAGAGEHAVIEYYKTIGGATQLPMIVQTRAGMSVDLVVEMFRQVPTMRCVKDEAGNPLARVREIRERTGGRLAVFSGNGVRTMIDEMRLGFSGHCPMTALADFYAAAFNLWHSGKEREAFDMFGRLEAFQSIPGAMDYVMVVRGVFHEETRTRGNFGAAQRLDEAAKQNVRDAWNEFMKPWVRG